MIDLHISLLGAFQVTASNGRPVPIETDKAQALLAYLALEADRPHTREALSSLFWPVADATKARASLRQALYTLKRSLDPPASIERTRVDLEATSLFRATRREVLFAGKSQAWLDVAEFTDLVDACRSHPHRDRDTCPVCAERLQRAIDVYRGDLLAGLTLADCPAFDEWRLVRQETLHRQAVAAMRHLSTYYERLRDYERAARCLERELALEPWREEAHRQRMRVLALSGQRAAALDQYRLCCRVLAEELGTVPSVETTDLLWQIEAGTTQPEYRAWQEFQTALPYKGLSSFAEMDAADFYGRETFAGRLLLAVQRPPELAAPVVALVGPSGCGKSSLVYAGLLPRLRASGDWQVIGFRPGARPFRRLAEALALLFPGSSQHTAPRRAALAAALESGERSLAEMILQIPALSPGQVRPGASAQRRLLIIVDAFEELYTRCTNLARRRAFLDLLFSSITDSPLTVLPYTVLFTLRADFFQQALAYPGMDHVLRQECLIMGRMSRTELQRAIQEPARARGVAYEPGLVARLLDDVGDEPGNLPLLQFTLTRLWDQQHNLLLTHAAYDELGGVSGALASYAETVYGRLDSREREIARRAFTRMVSPGQGTRDARRPLARAELSQTEWQLVRKLADARLVVTDRDESGGETAELVHDALIHAWERLRGWVEADRALHFWLHRLRLAIRQWKSSGQDEGALLRGALLGEAEGWRVRRADDLSAGQQAFIAAGVAVRDREQREAQARARAMEQAALLAQSLRMAANARLALRDNDTDLALALAWEANQVPSPPPESQSVLAEAAYAPGTRRIYRGHRAGVQCLALSPDGRTILSGSVDRTLVWWDLATGRALARLKGHDGTVLSAAFLPDGHTALSSSADHTLILWDLKSGEALRRFYGHTDEVLDVVFCHALGLRGAGAALSASRDQTLILWDVATGNVIRRLEGHQGAVLCLAAALEGVALSGSEDGSLILWDLAQGTAIRRLPHDDRRGRADAQRGHAGFVQDVALMPNGRAAISVSEDQRAILWDLESGEVARTYPVPDMTMYTVAVDQDGQRALLGTLGGEALLLDLRTGHVSQRLLGHRGRVVATSFQPDGRGALSGSADGTLRLWDLDSGAELRRHSYDPAMGAALSLDVSADERRALTGFFDGSLILWDVATGKELHRWRGHTEAVFAGLRFLPDGRRAVSGSGDIVARAYDNTVRLWDLETATEQRCYEGHTDRLWGLALSPCGRYVLSGGHDGAIWLWDLHAGAQEDAGKLLLDLGPQAVRSVAIGPEGRFALAGPAKGTSSAPNYDVLVLDLETGQVVGRLKGHHEAVTAIAISPDARWALSGAVDGRLHLWDLANRELVRMFNGHSRPVLRVRFGPHDLAFSSSLDSSVIVWDVATGKPKRRLLGHTAGVTDIHLLRGGQSLISVGVDSTRREWRVDATQQALVEWIRANRYVPELTPEQRAEYRVDLLDDAPDKL